MYFLSLAWLLTVTGNVPPGFDASSITIPGIVHNLAAVTLGNIVGGGGFVGFVYWAIYRKGLGADQAKPLRKRSAQGGGNARRNGRN